MLIPQLYHFKLSQKLQERLFETLRILQDLSWNMAVSWLIITMLTHNNLYRIYFCSHALNFNHAILIILILSFYYQKWDCALFSAVTRWWLDECYLFFSVSQISQRLSNERKTAVQVIETLDAFNCKEKIDKTYFFKIKLSALC